MQHQPQLTTDSEQRAGLLFALGSVLLVSIAQLCLKYAMQQWPVAPTVLDAVAVLIREHSLALLVPLGFGIVCYVLSVLSWLVTLGKLPLSVAYPLLSLSYLLVQCGTLFLPGFHELFSIPRFSGLILIVIGVYLLTPQNTARCNGQL